jgi:hypothetical protein
MNLLVPYVKLPDHNDPLFEEFTYGDVDQRGRKLKTLQPGDHLFFHTTIRGRKCITACYTVARVLDTSDVVEDPDLMSKFRNPHIARWLKERRNSQHDDVMVFGDPITSRVLAKPLPFDRKLATRLSLNIPFPKGRLESQAIGSATRSWRQLSDKDVRILRKAIKQCEAETEDGEVPLSLEGILTTEEVSQVIEKHIEGLLYRNPKLIANGVTSKKRQVETDEGRIDLLLETKSGHIIVVEVKLHRIGRDAVKQLRDYMNWVRKGRRKQSVSGVIVCEGVLPAFAEDLANLKDIKVMCYGWQLKLQPWPCG